MVGTKNDLREDQEVLEELRKKNEKPTEESDGHTLAQKMNAYKYMECSALNRQGLKNVFDQAIISVLNQKKSKKKNKKCSLL